MFLRVAYAVCSGALLEGVVDLGSDVRVCAVLSLLPCDRCSVCRVLVRDLVVPDVAVALIRVVVPAGFILEWLFIWPLRLVWSVVLLCGRSSGMQFAVRPLILILGLLISPGMQFAARPLIIILEIWIWSWIWIWSSIWI